MDMAGHGPGGQGENPVRLDLQGIPSGLADMKESLGGDDVRRVGAPHLGMLGSDWYNTMMLTEAKPLATSLTEGAGKR
jgi:hypothetical protein